jgi:FAD synthetase
MGLTDGGRNRPEQLSLSYNGGKDCLVLLLLILAGLHRFYNPQTILEKLPAIYIRPKHPFPEVDDFVASSSQEYCLELKTSPLPMKAALAEYLATSSPTTSSAEEQCTAIKAIFVGTRRTDPHGASLTHFDPTDGDWPRVMRVHPVIDWHYVDIWAFIRAVGVGYCPLYDRGYTSLGGTDDTLPNPALAKEGKDGFRPAFELVRDQEERLGREG